MVSALFICHIIVYAHVQKLFDQKEADRNLLHCNGSHADIFMLVHSAMMDVVAASAKTPNPMITPEIAAMVGTSPPTILSLSSSTIQRRLGDNTLDIGMCGFFITPSRMELFDYSNPFYFASGLQAVVPKPVNLPTFASVFTAVFGTIDDRAQLVASVLLMCVFIFGHLIAFAEHLHVGSKKTLVRDGYFEATEVTHTLTV
jgi:hypothetical protein